MILNLEMKKRTHLYFILFILLILIILVFGLYYLPKLKDQNSGYDEWANRDCPYGKLTVGCIPEPPPINLSKKGEYREFFPIESYSFLNQYINENNPNQVGVFKVLDVLFNNSNNNVTFNIAAKIDYENNEMWVKTGIRRPGTLAGHFMGWDERGFYPEKEDIIKVNITYVYITDDIYDYDIRVSSA